MGENNVKKILRKIPGFRTGVIWKMAVAVIGYIYMFLILSNPRGVTFNDKVIDFLTSLIIIGIPFLLATNSGNIRSRLPLFKKNTLKSNVMGALVVILIMSTSILILGNLKSPEQKQFEETELPQNFENLLK